MRGEAARHEVDVRPAPAHVQGAMVAVGPDAYSWLHPYELELELVALRFRRDVERGADPEQVGPLGWVP